MDMAYTIASCGTTICVGIITGGGIGYAIIFYGRAFTYLQLLVELIGGINGQVKSIDTIVAIMGFVGVLVGERAQLIKFSTSPRIGSITLADNGSLLKYISRVNDYGTHIRTITSVRGLMHIHIGTRLRNGLPMPIHSITIGHMNGIVQEEVARHIDHYRDDTIAAIHREQTIYKGACLSINLISENSITTLADSQLLGVTILWIGVEIQLVDTIVSPYGSEFLLYGVCS